MFYPILQEIFKDKDYMNQDRIEELDQWLGFLPKTQWDKITVKKCSERFNYEYEISKMILKELCRYKVLDEIYAVICPECGLILKILESYDVEEYISEEKYCYSCNNYFEVELDDIQIRYKLIMESEKNPKLPSILEKNKYSEIEKLDEETLKSFFQKEGTHSFYYDPKIDEYKELERLYEEAKRVDNNKNEKGSKFEDLIEFLMNRIKPIDASKEIHTETNQLDTFCVNRYVNAKIEGRIENIVLKKMGRTFICECKNEGKSPKNDYFGKLSNILLMSSDEDISDKFGIIFSLKKAPKTYIEMAKKLYFRNGTIIINIFKDDLDDIIYEKKNFLSILEFKIAVITKDLKESKIKYAKDIYCK